MMKKEEIVLRILKRVVIPTLFSLLGFGATWAQVNVLDARSPFGMMDRYSFHGRELSDSSLVFYCGYIEGSKVINRVLIYDKQDLSLRQDWRFEPYGPETEEVGQQFFRDSSDVPCFYTCRWKNDTNYVRISRWQNGTIDTNYQKFKIAGAFFEGFLYHRGEYFFISSKWGNRIDSTLIDVRNGQGQRLRHRWFETVYGDTSRPPGPFYRITILNPQLHPLTGNLVFGERLECNYLEIGIDSLDIKDIQHTASLLIPGPTYITPFYVTDFVLTKQGVRCGGLGLLNHFEDPFDPWWEDEYYYAFRPWGDSIRLRQGFGPDSVNNVSYAFTYDESRETGFLAGSFPFDAPAFYSPEEREILIYRFNEHGTDSIILYGEKNHVPLWVHADENSDLYVYSVYNEAWTTDSTYFLLTKIPGFAISLIERKETSPSIELYPNPARDYVYIDRLRDEVLEVELYSQGGQLLQQQKLPEARLDIAHLKPGLYILVVTNAQGQRSQVLLQKE